MTANAFANPPNDPHHGQHLGFHLGGTLGGTLDYIQQMYSWKQDLPLHFPATYITDQTKII